MTSNGEMIQTTNRLSRGARLRRSRPLWLYGAVAVSVLVVVLIVFLRH